MKVSKDGLTIEAIQDDTLPLLNGVVYTERSVGQYIRDRGETTGCYLLKGEFGGIISVNIATEPPGKKVLVTGILYEDAKSGEIFIGEQSRKSVGGTFVKNLGETNFADVDGEDLRPQESVQIKPGFVVAMGELQLQYQM